MVGDSECHQLEGGIRKVTDAMQAHAIAVQETKLTQDGVLEASAALLQRNWKMLASPAVYKDTGLSGVLQFW